MTEEIAAPPGWADERVDTLFGALPDTPAIKAACDAYMSCIAARKAPAAPSDMLGTEFNGCRSSLRRTLEAQGLSDLAVFDARLEALEAEIASES